MGLIIPIDSAPKGAFKDYYMRARDRAIALCAQKAGISPNDIVTRDVVLGDSTSTDFKDLTVGTSATAGQEEWMLDGAMFTAGDLSNIITTTAGKQSSDVNDQTAMVFWGFADNSGTNHFTAIQFLKGSRTPRYWQIEHVYATGVPIGVSDEMIEYADGDTVKIKLGLRAGVTVVTGEDYAFKILGVLAEPKSKSKAESGA